MNTSTPTVTKDYTLAVAKSPLFRLSGEVRNMIWRGVLHLEGDEGITYGYGKDQQRELQVALVFTCHLIQQETASIFFLENEYDINCGDFDSKPLVALTRRFKTLDLSINTVLTNDPQAVWIDPDVVSWSNLMLWLERYHSGVVGLPVGPTFEQNSSAGVESRVVGTMFGMVDDLRHAEWEIVEAVLKRQRPVLIGCYDDWAKD